MPVIILTLFTVLSLALTTEVFCDDTDLKIKVETITQREYAGKAVTDGYGIEILTEEGYEQAKEIAAMQEKNNEMIQATLFSKAQQDNADHVSVVVEQLGLFDSSYAAADIQESTNTGSWSVLIAGLVLIIATGAGIALAIMWQRHRGVRV